MNPKEDLAPVSELKGNDAFNRSLIRGRETAKVIDKYDKKMSRQLIRGLVGNHYDISAQTIALDEKRARFFGLLDEETAEKIRNREPVELSRGVDGISSRDLEAAWGRYKKMPDRTDYLEILSEAIFPDVLPIDAPTDEEVIVKPEPMEEKPAPAKRKSDVTFQLSTKLFVEALWNLSGKQKDVMEGIITDSIKFFNARWPKG